MIEKIKKIIMSKKDDYRPYNMIICSHELHRKICNCECHKNKEVRHMIACCQIEKCPDCKKELRIRY